MGCDRGEGKVEGMRGEGGMGWGGDWREGKKIRAAEGGRLDMGREWGRREEIKEGGRGRGWEINR